jgi:hypothetical protein
MFRIFMAGLAAAALIAVSNEHAGAGPVYLGHTKAEVEAARVRLYEHEMDVRDRNPVAFDHKHPVLGKVLASEQGLDEFLSKHTFHKLWCQNTPFLWRVVYGDVLYHKIHPFVTAPGVPHSFPDLHTDFPPVDIHTIGPPGDPGGGDHANAVPEPSSWVLMASGLTFAIVAATRRCIYLRVTQCSGC